MKLFIVEDELRLRQSLAYNIPWGEHGIELTGMAEDGLEALLLIERKKPDILLLDIRIPGLDGLTLARKVHEAELLIKMIILSGHDNFAYAQKAMEFGVTKYLLKPAGEKEILQAVLDAADLLRREMDERHDLERLKRQWLEYLPHLHNSFFLGWLNGKYDERQIAQRSKELGIELSIAGGYAVAILEMDPLKEDDLRFGQADLPLLEFSLNSMAKELLSSPFCCVCSDLAGTTIAIYHVDGYRDFGEELLGIHAAVDKLLAAVKACLKVTASAGISLIAAGGEALRPLYLQAESALQSRIVYGGNTAYPYRASSGASYAVTVEPKMEKSLETSLEIGDSDKALEALDGLWECGLSKADSPEMLRENVLYMSSLLLRTMQRRGWRVMEVVPEDFGYFQNLEQLVAKEQVWSWLQRVVKGIVAYVNKQRKSTSNHFVMSIVTIVDKEMDQELSLNSVADRLYVNASYLSKLFKQETGKPFSTYVLERKMERAKSTLLDGAKVTEAAMQVGFQDVSYFTKVFRKYWGITPSEMKA